MYENNTSVTNLIFYRVNTKISDIFFNGIFLEIEHNKLVFLIFMVKFIWKKKIRNYHKKIDFTWKVQEKFLKCYTF